MLFVEEGSEYLAAMIEGVKVLGRWLVSHLQKRPLILDALLDGRFSTQVQYPEKAKRCTGVVEDDSLGGCKIFIVGDVQAQDF